MKKEYLFIYCDGGCDVHGSKTGGYGIVLKYKEKEKHIYGYRENSTNNIMELTAAIKSLEAIKNKNLPTIITTDSNYVVKGMNEWIKNWLYSGWKSAENKDIKNQELWKKLYNEKVKFSDITFIHCYGHSDNEYNNLADKLATKAKKNKINSEEY